MSDTEIALPPKHNILFTIPRTASNLMIKILNLPNQPSILRHKDDGYFFLLALLCRYQLATFTRPLELWSDDETNEINRILQENLQTYLNFLDEADHLNKSTFIKEHINFTTTPLAESQFLHENNNPSGPLQAPPNPTCIPSHIFTRIAATFLIRHPTLVFPSLLRSAIANEGLATVLSAFSDSMMSWEATYHWHVTLYRFLASSSAYSHRSYDAEVTFPIVIDASDLGNERLMRRYAGAVGLDANVVRFKWDVEEMAREGEEVGARMMETLRKSRGVVEGKLRDADEIDEGEEAVGWEEEFGEVLTGRLRRLVDGAREDYKWLWARRMTM